MDLINQEADIEQTHKVKPERMMSRPITKGTMVMNEVNDLLSTTACLLTGLDLMASCLVVSVFMSCTPPVLLISIIKRG